MNTAVFITFGILSLIVLVSFSVYCRAASKSTERTKNILLPVHILTVGVFFAVIFLFIPIYYLHYDFKDNYKIFRPLLLSIHHAIRIFILDSNINDLVEALKDQHVALRVIYSLYASILHVVAPVLTFSNVLSLFKNIKGEFLYRIYKNKSFYIMSELNLKSVSLAKDIKKSQKDEAVIVFTDVFEQNEENYFELLNEIKELNAICLKKDITHIDLISKKGNVELFLIGEDESENVSQAVKITNRLNTENKKYNVKIFVFSKKASAGYILDSVRFDNLLKHAGESGYKADKTFKLRRVDEVKNLVWNTVPGMNVFDLADNREKILSVLIVGFGSYGMEFFKTLLWFCQFDGYKLQINILDKDDVEPIIRHQCPEILETNRVIADGEACYDIEIFSGVDVTATDLNDIVLYTGKDEKLKKLSNRLRKTNLAVVTLGDDDLNVEVAVELRGAFDRMDLKEKTDKLLRHAIEKIFHIDTARDEKAKNKFKQFVATLDMRNKDKADIIWCYEKIISYYENGSPVNGSEADVDMGILFLRIDAIFRDKYKEDLLNLYNKVSQINGSDCGAETIAEYLSLTECLNSKSGLPHTKDSVQLYAVVYDELKSGLLNNAESDKDEEFLINHQGNPYYINFIGGLSTQFSHENIFNQEEEELALQEHTHWANTEEKKKEETGKYNRFEYYRFSSIAKVLYHKAINDSCLAGSVVCLSKQKSDDCGCDNCTRAEKSEHMRWNAYTRTIGFTRGIRNDRARLHNDLCAWEELSRHEKSKDKTNINK